MNGREWICNGYVISYTHLPQKNVAKGTSCLAPVAHIGSTPSCGEDCYIFDLSLCLLFFSTANKRRLSEFDFNPTWRVLSGHETPFQALTILSKSHTKKTSNSGKVKVIDLESFFLQA